MSSPEAKRPRNSRYPLRDRSKVATIPFEVPEWAGKKAVNTCIIDSFLAMLLCAKWKDPSFSTLLKGQSKFTEACREFLDGGDCDLEERKDEFIKKLFKPDKHGEFDLEGDEASMILDKAKEASQIVVTSVCHTCEKQVSFHKDYFYTGREERELSDLLCDALAQLNRRHRCLDMELCKNAERDSSLTTFDTTWMLPFDLSQIGLTHDKIALLPHGIEVAGVKFRLRGVSLFGGSHYTSVLFDDTDWYFYDGIDTPPIKMYSSAESLVVEPFYRIKIAYYLRVN